MKQAQTDPQGIVAQLRRLAEIPAFSQHVGVEVTEAADCLEEAAPLLRAHARCCEVCEGSGEIVVGHAPDDYWTEPCKHCKPIWDLIERIQPPAPPSPPPPQPVQVSTAEECDDDLPF